MTDIVERLGAWVVNDSAELSDDDLNEAADEIVRLRAELRRAHIDNAAAWGQPQVQAEEVARLRALIAEWAEADTTSDESPTVEGMERFVAARLALRKEANR